MRILVATLALSVSPLVPMQVLAADIDISSRIDAVTVYPDGALVARLADLDVPQGASTLIFKGLPSELDPDSVRIEARVDGALAIGSVEARLSPGSARPVGDAKLDAEIAALREESDRVSAKLEALEAKKKTILRYSELDPTRLARKSSAEDASSWKVTWDAIGDELARVNEEIRVETARAADLESRILTLQKASAGAESAGEPKHDIAIAIEAASAAKGSLTFAYRVSGARWTPRYEARLDTGTKDRKPSLALIRRAVVTQTTGEDWDKAALTVSTVRTRGGTAAPKLEPLIVLLAEPPSKNSPDKYDRKQSFRSSGGSAQAGGQRKPEVAAESDIDWRVQGGVRIGLPRLADPYGPRMDEAWSSTELARSYQATLELQPALATLDAGPYQASFKVPGRVSVSHDGSSKTFALSSASFAPALMARIVPSQEQAAYLKVSFVDSEDAPLLPGEVALTRDGVFVGMGHFPLIAPGDTAILGMGSDDRVKVARVPVRQEESEPSLFGNTRSRVTEFKTSVTNLHEAPIKVAVQDRMPVSETDRVTVGPLSSNTPPTEKVVADQRGVSEWTFDLGPAEQKDIRFGWRLDWPADRMITMGSRTPHWTGGNHF